MPPPAIGRNADGGAASGGCTVGERGKKADGGAASVGWTVGERGKKAGGGGAFAGSMCGVGMMTEDSGKNAV